MMSLKAKLSKIWKQRWVLRALLPSVIFNFRHLPAAQAWHLPILLYKPHLLNNTGSFEIVGPVSFGMIRLGVYGVSLYPSSGIVIENRGKIVFHGKAVIGNDSAISLGSEGVLVFGKNFRATTAFKCACYYSITFEDDVLVGWNTMVMDTDFHAVKRVDTGKLSKGYGAVSVGHDTWIANGCRIYKNVHIPHSCVVGAGTVLHNITPPHCNSLIVNTLQVETKSCGLYHDKNDDGIDYLQK